MQTSTDLHLLHISTTAWLSFFIATPYISASVKTIEGVSDFAGYTHSIFVSILAMACIASVIDEEKVVIFTVPYFVIDSVYSFMRRKRRIFVLHHAVTLGMIWLARRSIVVVEGKVISHILLVEVSTVVLYIWRWDRESSLKYWTMLVLYFFNRVVWLGWYVYAPNSYLARLTETADIIGLWIARLLHLMCCVWWWQLSRKASKYYGGRRSKRYYTG